MGAQETANVGQRGDAHRTEDRVSWAIRSLVGETWASRRPVTLGSLGWMLKHQFHSGGFYRLPHIEFPCWALS